MKITTARKWYGEGSGIVIKTDDYLIDLFTSTKFLVGTFYSPRTADSWCKSYVLALGWLRIEITEDEYWEDM